MLLESTRKNGCTSFGCTRRLQGLLVVYAKLPLARHVSVLADVAAREVVWLVLAWVLSISHVYLLEAFGTIYVVRVWRESSRWRW